MAEEVQAIINMDIDNNEEGEEEANEEFYENIEAPKFVDFTTSDHYHPDDRYWFCLRVGCDQKHEEEIDPEAISKNFVLRVMAARSPNVKFQKALNRTASSNIKKCPGSAPPKSSKSRISRLALISSFSGKLVDQEAKVKVKPQQKLTSTTSTTPMARTKQVAAKYLTTPSHKKCLPNPNGFRSVQNPKPSSLTVPKTRTVSKALIFNSPKKGILVKTSVELKTPLTKLCDGMKKLELSSKKKRVLGCSSKSDKEPGPKSSRKLRVTFKDQSSEKKKPTLSAQEIKPARSLKRVIKGNLTKTEANEELPNAKKELEKCKFTVQKIEETGLESSDLPSTDQTEVLGDDDKENASVFDENRGLEHNNSETRKKGMEEALGNIKKKLEKNLKEDISLMKFKKPKATNPKPFRFRTDERGILKEANLEKKVQLQAHNTKENGKASRFVDGNNSRKLEKSVHGNEKQKDVKLEKTRNDGERRILSDLKESSKPKRKGDLEEKKRAVTIPKGPNFHSSHRPRSCAKEIA